MKESATDARFADKWRPSPPPNVVILAYKAYQFQYQMLESNIFVFFCQCLFFALHKFSSHVLLSKLRIVLISFDHQGR